MNERHPLMKKLRLSKKLSSQTTVFCAFRRILTANFMRTAPVATYLPFASQTVLTNKKIARTIVQRKVNFGHIFRLIPSYNLRWTIVWGSYFRVNLVFWFFFYSLFTVVARPIFYTVVPRLFLYASSSLIFNTVVPRLLFFGHQPALFSRLFWRVKIKISKFCLSLIVKKNEFEHKILFFLYFLACQISSIMAKGLTILPFVWPRCLEQEQGKHVFLMSSKWQRPTSLYIFCADFCRARRELTEYQLV